MRNHTDRIVKAQKEKSRTSYTNRFKNLHVMMTQQPKKEPKQFKPMFPECSKKVNRALQRKKDQEPDCHRCDKKAHEDAYGRPKFESYQQALYASFWSHLENCFVKNRNEASEKYMYFSRRVESGQIVKQFVQRERTILVSEQKI